MDGRCGSHRTAVIALGDPVIFWGALAWTAVAAAAGLGPWRWAVVAVLTVVLAIRAVRVRSAGVADPE